MVVILTFLIASSDDTAAEVAALAFQTFRMLLKSSK